MAYSKSTGSRKFSSALMALAIALVMSTEATAGSDQIASLPLPSIEESSGNIDLRVLETKIRNTNAINFFAKLELKAGIDSLINAFGQFHNGQSTDSLKGLKARFEDFLRSTVSMLRKGDASLAKELENSREGLWKALNNSTEFLEVASVDRHSRQD